MENVHMEEILNSVERRLWLYMGMIHSVSGMWTWCFSESGDLYYTSCPNEEELKQFFYIGGCMDYAIQEGSTLSHPFMMNDTLGMVWAGEYAQFGSEKRLVVIGPVFYLDTSMQYVGEKMKELNLSVQMRAGCMKILSTVPVVPMTLFMNQIQSLHYMITLEESKNLALSFQNVEEETVHKESSSDKSRLIDYENNHMQEELLLQCIRDGNENYLEAFEHIKLVHTDQMHVENPQRHFSNVLIIFTALCARAAVEGGLPPRIAKEIEWKYVNQIEKQKTIIGLTNLNRAMMDEFVARVNESKNSCGISKQIKECCAYVKNHFTEALTLERIAKEVGYTEYYLTRKFQKEMGIKLLDYIKEVRLEYAKVWLATTNKSVQDISSELQFGARSYFSRVFKDKNGMTPAEYRDRMWNGGNKSEAERKD